MTARLDGDAPLTATTGNWESPGGSVATIDDGTEVDSPAGESVVMIDVLVDITKSACWDVVLGAHAVAATAIPATNQRMKRRTSIPNHGCRHIANPPIRAMIEGGQPAKSNLGSF